MQGASLPFNSIQHLFNSTNDKIGKVQKKVATSQSVQKGHPSLPSAALRNAAATAGAELSPEGSQELKLRHADGAKDLAPPEGPQKNSSSSGRKRKTLTHLDTS